MGRRHPNEIPAGKVAHPEQPDHHHVEHDQSLPEIEVSELEPLLVPLAEVEQTNDAQDIYRLHGENADDQASQLRPPGGRKGEDGRNQDGTGLHRVAAGHDGDAKAIGRTLDDVGIRRDVGIKELHQIGAEACLQASQGHDEAGLHRAEQLNPEQRDLNDQEENEESQHKYRCSLT
ncbi:hypothetical protein NTGHW29_300069 [Candidatus Nitrotoga sp. HW29]|nr:hypothetical protein NTGHW29_300069 [Candidatus Nitrotoga sp. HW29]